MMNRNVKESAKIEKGGVGKKKQNRRNRKRKPRPLLQRRTRTNPRLFPRRPPSWPKEPSLSSSTYMRCHGGPDRHAGWRPTQAMPTQSHLWPNTEGPVCASSAFRACRGGSRQGRRVATAWPWTTRGRSASSQSLAIVLTSTPCVPQTRTFGSLLEHWFLPRHRNPSPTQSRPRPGLLVSRQEKHLPAAEGQPFDPRE